MNSLETRNDSEKYSMKKNDLEALAIKFSFCNKLPKETNFNNYKSRKYFKHSKQDSLGTTLNSVSTIRINYGTLRSSINMDYENENHVKLNIPKNMMNPFSHSTSSSYSQYQGQTNIQAHSKLNQKTTIPPLKLPISETPNLFSSFRSNANCLSHRPKTTAFKIPAVVVSEDDEVNADSDDYKEENKTDISFENIINKTADFKTEDNNLSKVDNIYENANMTTNTGSFIRDKFNNTSSFLNDRSNISNLTDIQQPKEQEFNNYENLYIVNNIYTELTSMLENKNYQYNKLVVKWFDNTSNNSNDSNSCLNNNLYMIDVMFII